MKSKYDDSKLKEIVVQVLQRYMFFSEEEGLVQDDDEDSAQREIMDSHSSVIAETVRKVSMCNERIGKNVITICVDGYWKLRIFFYQ